MSVPTVGSLNDIVFHAQTAPNGYNIPQIVPVEISQPGMLGDLVIWGGYKSGETPIITKTLCADYASAVDVEETAQSYVGYTCDLVLASLDNYEKQYYAVVMGCTPFPMATNLDDPDYTYIVTIGWRFKLYPKVAS